MTAPDLLQTLAGLGVRLTVVAGELLWRAPAGVLTADLKSELAVNKAELLDILLCGEGGTDPGTFACWSCWAPSQPGRSTCQLCSAIAPGLTEEEIDAAIYGPGRWVVANAFCAPCAPSPRRDPKKAVTSSSPTF